MAKPTAPASSPPSRTGELSLSHDSIRAAFTHGLCDTPPRLDTPWELFEHGDAVLRQELTAALSPPALTAATPRIRDRTAEDPLDALRLPDAAREIATMIGPAAASTFIRHSPAITAQLARALRSRTLELRHVYDTVRGRFPELVVDGQLVDSVSDAAPRTPPTVDPAVADLQRKLDAVAAENRRLKGENAALQTKMNDLTSKTEAANTANTRTFRDLTLTRQRLANAVGFLHWLHAALCATGDSVSVVETRHAEERAIPFSNPGVASRALANVFSSLTAKQWLFVLDAVNRGSVPNGVVVLAQILPSVAVPLAVDATPYANREREILGHLTRVRSVVRLAADNFAVPSVWGTPSYLRELGAPTDADRRCRVWLQHVKAALAADSSANATSVISPLTLVVARPPGTLAALPAAAAGSRPSPTRTSNLAAILNPPTAPSQRLAESESDVEPEPAFDDDAPSVHSDDQAEALEETTSAPSRKRPAATAPEVLPAPKSAKVTASTISPSISSSATSVTTPATSSTSVPAAKPRGGVSPARTSSSSVPTVSRRTQVAAPPVSTARPAAPPPTPARSSTAATAASPPATPATPAGIRVFGFAGWTLRPGSTKTVMYHQVPCSATHDNDGYPNLAIFTGAVEYRTTPDANPGYRWDGVSVDAFMRTEPWKSTLDWDSWIHVFILYDPRTLDAELLVIVGRMLVLQRYFAPEYWARYHWLTIPRGKLDPKAPSTSSEDLLRVEYDSRKQRCGLFFEVYRSLVHALKVGAEAAARRGDDREPWDYIMWEPALWYLPPNVCLVIPPTAMSSATEIAALITRIDREEPLRVQFGGDPLAFAAHTPSTLPEHLRQRLRDCAAGSAAGYALPPLVADLEGQALRAVSAPGSSGLRSKNRRDLAIDAFLGPIPRLRTSKIAVPPVLRPGSPTLALTAPDDDHAAAPAQSDTPGRAHRTSHVKSLQKLHRSVFNAGAADDLEMDDSPPHHAPTDGSQVVDSERSDDDVEFAGTVHAEGQTMSEAGDDDDLEEEFAARGADDEEAEEELAARGDDDDDEAEEEPEEGETSEIDEEEIVEDTDVALAEGATEEEEKGGG